MMASVFAQFLNQGKPKMAKRKGQLAGPYGEAGRFSRFFDFVGWMSAVTVVD